MPTPTSAPVNPLQAVIANRVAQQQQRAAGVIVRPEILPAGQPSAQECFQHLQRSASNCRNAMLEIAYYGFRLRLANSWDELGFENEESCHEYLGIPQATWDRYLTVGERLQHLTLEELRGLSLASAQWLARVSPRIWSEYAWVEEARLLSSRDFAALVTQRNSEHKLLKATNEATVDFKLHIPSSRMRSFKQRLEKIRQGYDVRSAIEALERAISAAEKELAVNAKDSSKVSAADTSTGNTAV